MKWGYFNMINGAHFSNFLRVTQIFKMEEELSDEEKVSQFMAFTGSELQEAHTYLEV